MAQPHLPRGESSLSLAPLLVPFAPLARRPPRLCLRRAPRPLYGRGILKRVGPCAHNPPGLQPERIGSSRTDRLNAIASSTCVCSSRARGSGRSRENTPCEKSRRTCAAVLLSMTTFRLRISKAVPFTPAAKNDRVNTRREAVIFISTLISIASRTGDLGKGR